MLVNNKHYNDLWVLIHGLETMLLERGEKVRKLDELREKVFGKENRKALGKLEPIIQ